MIAGMSSLSMSATLSSRPAGSCVISLFGMLLAALSIKFVIDGLKGSGLF